MLTEYEWLNYGNCSKDEVLSGEVIAFINGVPLMRGVVHLEDDFTLFISFAVTKHLEKKQLLKVVNNFKYRYDHFKWVANINKNNEICLNFAKRFSFCENLDIMLEDEELIYVERPSQCQNQFL